MKKIDNLFPALFALAGILFVVWGISAGASSESAGQENGAAAKRLQPELKLLLIDKGI